MLNTYVIGCARARTSLQYAMQQRDHAYKMWGIIIVDSVLAREYRCTLYDSFECRSLYGWRALSLSDAWLILLLHTIRGRKSHSPYVLILRCIACCVRVSWGCFVLLIGKTFWCKWFFCLICFSLCSYACFYMFFMWHVL